MAPPHTFFRAPWPARGSFLRGLWTWPGCGWDPQSGLVSAGPEPRPGSLQLSRPSTDQRGPQWPSPKEWGRRQVHLLLLGTSPAASCLSYGLLVWVPRVQCTSPSGPHPTALGLDHLFWGAMVSALCINSFNPTAPCEVGTVVIHGESTLFIDRSLFRGSEYRSLTVCPCVPSKELHIINICCISYYMTGEESLMTPIQNKSL